ncbi:MAG: carboxynorspermidine decarboxylase [Lentisphaeria bacterium]|nr:carboxynorspermidine decarboxylase [Lentisphaeria bacterium]
MSRFPADLPSPCFVLEQAALRRNLAVLARVQREAGVKIILALKGFAMHAAFPEVRRVLPGCTASSLYELRLAHEEFGGEVHAYAPVYPERDFPEYARHCTHLTFNSLAQCERFRDRAPGVSLGLRVNPQYSPVETDLYNPCVPGSRLGIRAELLGDRLPAGVEGLHVHNLCESAAEATARTLLAIEEHFGRFLPDLRWLNLGGGHLMTRAGYDLDGLIAALRAFRQRHPHLEIILEPGSAVAWDTGVLVATVEDVVASGGIHTAILDASFATHMPDCLEMPYRPNVEDAWEPDGRGWECRLGGCSCLAGDFVAGYAFAQPLRPGDRVVFRDMMHYTMVKTNTFNGIPLPAIGILGEDGGFQLVQTPDYHRDYRNRLS